MLQGKDSSLSERPGTWTEETDDNGPSRHDPKDQGPFTDRQGVSPDQPKISLWEKVRENRGAGGVDAVSITEFSIVAIEELEKLHQEPVLLIRQYKKGLLENLQ